MGHFEYVVIGGGIAADSAVQAIREIDPSGAIGVFSRERHPFYNRPPLSKALWKGEPEETVWRQAERPGVEMLLGRSVRSIDRQTKTVTDDGGQQHGYGKLLFATGGRPRTLPFGDGAVLYYRTLDDYRRLRQMAEKGQKFLVIGAGFIGSEIAAALRMAGKDVVLVFPEQGIGSRVFPAEMSRALNGFYESKGVEVVSGVGVVGVESRGQHALVRLTDGRTFYVDGVVAGVGIQPNMELAKDAGLSCDDGIEVDQYLRTSDPDIFAAGDCVSFPSATLQVRQRIEHEDAALTQGRSAGRAMAGQIEPYLHLPMFYADLFDLGYEAVGECDSRLDTVCDWKEPQREGVVYYLQRGKVRGVLCVNTWGKVDEARALVASGETFSAESLVGRIRA